MSEFQAIKLNHQFRFALKELEHSSDHYFITGKAGTGKSTLLQLFRKSTKKNCVVLAPTGIAALNVHGQTIHSFFRFPSRPIALADIRRLRNNRIYKLMDILIIDEISMVRADLFDAIDHFLRINRDQPDIPFGGVQLILFGDIFQLPPVVASLAEKNYFSTSYPSPYFFDAQAFDSGFEMQLIELTEVFRQKDKRFKQILDEIRLNQVDWETIQELNSRVGATLPTDKSAINLCTTNAIADRINSENLNRLEGESMCFNATISGKYTQSRFPTEEHLILKEGAQVMFVRNDPEKMYVNGTLGTVSSLRAEEIFVKYQDSAGLDREEPITTSKWELLEYKNKEDRIESNVIGSFTQFPLKLAWAISIHKSQGKTFDLVNIHLGRGAFESGQTYVALSRCTQLEGISLSKPLRAKDIFIDERLIHFHRALLK